MIMIGNSLQTGVCRSPGPFGALALAMALLAMPCLADDAVEGSAEEGKEEAAAGAATEEAAAELAKKLANPIASLISVPIQYNFDQKIGPNDQGSIKRVNIQPVIPMSLNAEWNLISRVIIPIVDQDDIPAQGVGETGLGDVVMSQFFSPKAPTRGGWIWGAGPVTLLPTATDDQLGGEKWGLGPTAVALKQSGPWTVGALANHIWSVGGNSDRADVNATFVQPFLAYVTRTQTTFSTNTEATYDWKTRDWSVPLNVSVSQLVRIGPQIMQFQVGTRYWLDSPPTGPEGWGVRFQATFLFPR